jgi:hypothetical protein
MTYLQTSLNVYSAASLFPILKRIRGMYAACCGFQRFAIVITIASAL